MPKVSVLVPIYNVDEYLNQCLDSILNQTLKEIEIICIDDGSTDKSGKILDDYALKDSRVKVIHQENAGYGVAMNTGLSMTTGEYIGIVESDDKILPDMYQVLYEAAKKNDLDMVKSEAYYWYEKIDFLARIHESSMDEYFDQILTDMDRNLFFRFFTNIWTGIYKRDFLINNDIRFHESSGASYQDNGFWMQTCLYVKRAMWLNEAFYYYRQDNPEASIKSTSKMYAMTLEYEYLERLLFERKQEYLLPYCYSMKLFRLRGNYYRIDDSLKLSFRQQVESDYNKYQPHIRYNIYMDHWIRNFLHDAEGFTKKTIDKKQYVRNMIEMSDGIIIYGAGKQGDRVLRLLYNEGYYERIRSFAVTEESDYCRKANIDILNIEDACTQFPNAVVIIAVIPGTNACKEMSAILNRLGMNKIIYTDELFDYFYLL